MQIFLSYSRNDRQMALNIAKELELSDRENIVWTEAELFPGDNWPEARGKALRESDAMVVLLTSDASGSDWIDHEIEYALSQKQYQDKLVPVIVGEDIKMDDFPWVLRELSSLHLTNPENPENIKTLTEDILSILAPVSS